MLEGKNEQYPPPAILEISLPGLLSKRTTANRPQKGPLIKKKKESGAVNISKSTDVIEIDDDFGMLFDWVTHLDENDLGDFREVQIKA